MSTFQHLEAVISYISKERAHVAILNPIVCSPLLTTSRDLNKYRVILDLSYPKGLSFSDQVDMQLFLLSQRCIFH